MCLHIDSSEDMLNRRPLPIQGWQKIPAVGGPPTAAPAVVSVGQLVTPPEMAGASVDIRDKFWRRKYTKTPANHEITDCAGKEEAADFALSGIAQQHVSAPLLSKVHIR